MTEPLTDAKLLEVLERQGYRELVSAHLFAGGVRVAPSIDDKHMLVQHASEELAHFELVASTYEETSGHNLYETVASRAETMPIPGSWPEVVVAAYLVDHAAAIQLGAYQQLGDKRLLGLIRKIVDHEHEHKTAAETALRDLCQDAGRKELARRHLARWYPLACAVMDGSEQAQAAFAESLRRTLESCGLELPSGGG